MELTEVDVNAALEQSTENLDNLGPGHVKLAGQSQSFWYVLRVKHSFAHSFFKETEPRTLCDGMADGKLDHVVGARHQSDHIVEYARALHVGAILEMKFFRLKIVLIQWTGQQADAVFSVRKCKICQDVFFLMLCEVPEDYYSV